MKNKSRYLYNLFLVLAVTLAGCQDTTDVELCYQGQHPHPSETKFSFAFNDGTTHADSAYIMAQRIIHAEKFGIKCCTANGSGHFFQDARENATYYRGSSFPILQGEYKMLAITRDSNVFYYDKLDSTANASSTSWNLDKLALAYKPYKDNSTTIKTIIPDWKDFNNYAEYVLNNSGRVYADTVELCHIHQGKGNQVAFSLKPITQALTISFSIKKQAANGVTFKIDSVVADLSGIPSGVELLSRRMNIRKTYKMLMLMNLGHSDSFDADTLSCRNTFNALGVIHSASDRSFTGPGILQVVIFVTVRDHGKTVRRRVQGKMNLFHCLLNNGLLEYSLDGTYARQTASQGNINIVNPLRIDANGIIGSTADDWGIDKWIPSGSTQIIEL